jgi:hypothetical protein
MRITRLKRRSVAILAVAAAAGAVAVVGIAMAAPSPNASSSLEGSRFFPGTLPKNTFQAGRLFVHTHANYNNPGNTNPQGATRRAQLYFDDDGKLNPRATPKCDPADISGNITMKAAMAACGSSLVSIAPSKAQAIQPSPAGDFVVNGCVLVFNGKLTSLVFTRVQVASPPNNTINCSNPSQNENGNTSILLRGIVKPNPASLGPDFEGGRQVDYNNIDDAAAIPLTDFQVNVRKSNYISARCHDGNHRLNIRGKFTYNDDTTDTVSESQTCTVG